MQMSITKFMPTYISLQISRYLSSPEPHIAIVSTGQPVPG